MTQADMKIKAIAPWFGGKRSMAADIVRELGKHSMYVEPFAGSMAVLFAKEPSSHETANDLHGHLTNMARVIAHEQLHIDLFNRLQRTLYCDDLLTASREYIQTQAAPDPHSVSIEAAYHYFNVSWMGRNGVAGTARINYQKATRWTPGGGGGPKRFQNTVATIPAWSQRLRNVDILSMDAFDLLSRLHDSPKTVIYLDPPYIHETRGSARYEHDFDSSQHSEEHALFRLLTKQAIEKEKIDKHAQLAKSLGRFKKARVVVSYYDCDRVRDLYDGWTFRMMTRQKNLHVQNRRGAGTCEAPEVLIINGPSYTEAA